MKMYMYMEPELEIIKFNESQVTTLEIASGHEPGIEGDGTYDDLLQ